MNDTNPRYSNYARAHGRIPEEQLKADRAEWPGAPMVGFVQWNRMRLVEASKEIPEAFYLGQVTDHAAYDAWLTKWVDDMPTQTSKENSNVR